MTQNTTPRIVILGGGFGGLETAFLLRKELSAQEASILLISAEDKFLFKPNTIYIPYGLNPDKLRIGLRKPTARKAIDFLQADAQGVDPQKKRVRADGHDIAYDYLVVATGASMCPSEIPGMTEYAQTIWTPDEMLRLRSAYQKLLTDAQRGLRQRVLFVVPRNNKCSGPLYEMVFMLDTWLRRKKVRPMVDLTWSTYEHTFIQAFGPRLHQVASGEFTRRGIEAYADYEVERITRDEAVYTNGKALPYDMLIAFPPYIASTQYRELPLDDRGFITTNLATRQVVGYPDMYVAGDAGDFPVKQAFLAFLQGDTVAMQIASAVRDTAPRMEFDPLSMCVMEDYDKATFAQVPLQLTGDPERPVAVRAGADALYKVGSHPMWRLGKKMLGLYLPWRFTAGNPFHAGLPWNGMEFGLKVMSAVFAQ
jgi:sulfide:quinone oxidoreductase